MLFYINTVLLKAYSNCLAQAVFAAFHEAFPESDRLFQDRFKQQLADTINEWVAGIAQDINNIIYVFLHTCSQFHLWTPVIIEIHI